MLELDLAKWSQPPEDLRVEVMTAAQTRTRERLLALYELTQLGLGASAAARSAGRHLQTLIRWVHRYIDTGPQAWLFEHTGGIPLY